MRRETTNAQKGGARRETLDASEARRETRDVRRVSSLSSCNLVSRLTSHAPAPWPKVKLGEEGSARHETIDASEARHEARDGRRVSSLSSCNLVSRLTSHAPTPWPKVKLEDVAIGIYDGPHATPPPCDKAGYYFLGIPQITPAGHIDLSNPRYISKADYAKWTKRVVPCEGDVVFSYEATLNLYAMIPKDKRCCLGRRMGLVRPDTAKLDARFLYYYFFSPEWRKTVMENTVVGATVDRLPIKTFPSFKISLPPLPVQRRIADILSAYDDLIENNRRRIAILEETARLTYRKWFGGVEQCGTATLGEIAPFVRGKVITLKNAVHGKVPVVAGGLEPAYFHNVANTGAPVITISGSGANAGFTRMYFEPIWVSDCSWCDKAKAKWFYFAYCFLKDNADALQNLQQGAAQPHVYPKDINALEVALPKSDDLLDNFEESVEPLFSQCGVLAKQNTALAIVREMLLPRLMKGEVA